MKPIDEVSFLRKLQRLLEEGDFVATYKFALLQALADLSVENEPATDGTLRLPLSMVAEKFIEYYWRQARPYRNGLMLAQNHGRQAAILNRVALAHLDYHVSLAAARRDRAGWQRLAAAVAGTVEQMPLWKLQIVGGEPEEFLYRADNYRDRQILLEPGVADCFRSFHPFIVNMVRGAWVDHMLRIRANQELVGEQGDLSEFLFGSERRSLDEYRAVLQAYQANRCFYCDQRVTGNGALDHFIPWARYPVDLGHNFVFAHLGCNRQKRDYLAHPEHLARWREQNLDSAEELGRHFDEAVLRHDAGRTQKIAVWAYQQAELAEANVWVAADRFQRLEAGWRAALRLTT